MRKIFLFMMVSADGYFEGTNHDLSWHNVDAEFDDFANKQLDEADTLVMGRRTFQLMESAWPTKGAAEAEPGTAERMNRLRKIVFSRQAFTTDWEPTDVESDVNVLAKLKQQAGKDIAILGSSNLCLTLLEKNLLDEIRLMINPIVIGKGTPLFAGIDGELKLKLTNLRQFQSGDVLLYYALPKGE